MLPREPVGLYDNIKASEKARKRHLQVFRGQVERFHTPFHSSVSDVWRHDDYSPENHAYELVSMMIPQLVYNNPKATVRSRRFEHQLIAKGLEYGLNRWVVDNNFAEVIEPTAVDHLFNYGVLHIAETANLSLALFDKGSSPMWPKVERISQRYFIRDHLALTIEGCRYMGHQWVIDKEDLLTMAREDPDGGWHLDVIAGLPSQPDAHRATSKAPEEDPDRKQLTIYSLWVPEHEHDDDDGSGDFNGTAYTIAVARRGDETQVIDFVRAPRPFYGPRWGPYAITDVYRVPDSTYGLAPLVATEGQQRDLNRHARGISEAAARYKRLVLVDKVEGDMAGKIERNPSDLVIPISGLKKDMVFPLEIGGPPAEMVAYIETILRPRLQRNSGLSETGTGRAPSNVTASAEILADQAGDIRTDYYKLKYHRGITKALRTALWYIAMNKDTRIQLGFEESQELARDLEGAGQEVPNGEQFVIGGGDLTPIRGGGFDELELEIEPMSMERTTEGVAQMRALRMFEVVAQIAELIPMNPGVDWKGVIEWIGQAFNMPRLGEMIDVEKQMQGAPTEQSQKPGFSKTDGGSPRGNGRVGMQRPMSLEGPAQAGERRKLSVS